MSDWKYHGQFNPGGNPNHYELSSSLDGEAVISLDWSEVAGLLETTTQNVAQVVADYLSTDLGNLGTSLLALPIHLIGHSRGASLVGALARELGEAGIWIDQVTYLDAHPITGDYGNGLFDNIGATENVLFADSYYQERLLDLAPDGETVDGSRNYKLDADVFDASGYGGAFGPHSDVHLWYHGTVDKLNEISDGEVNNFNPDAFNWYAPPHPRSTSGYYFSRVQGGTRENQGVGQPFGGDGARKLVGSSGLQWPNIGDILIGNPNNVVALGDKLALSFRYQDRDDAATAAFFLDDDQNPYNGYVKELGDHPVTTSPNSPTISSTSLSVFGVPIGNYFVFAKMISNNGGLIRYAYSAERLTVDPEPLCPLPTCPENKDRYEPDDTPGTAKNISTFGDIQTHSLHSSTDVDWIRFTAPHDATEVFIETSGVTGDTKIYLYGPNNADTFVDDDDDGGLNLFSRIQRLHGQSLDFGQYHLKIEESGQNAAIDEYFVSVLARNRTPDAPSGLIATPTSPTSVHLRWKINDKYDRLNLHLIERRNRPDGNWEQVGSAGGNVTSWEDHSVDPNTIYDFRVSAVYASWHSNFSDPATVTTPGIPEIDVMGNGVSIQDGDTTPNPDDHTHYGTVFQGQPGPTRTYTVRNDGTATLTLGSVIVPSDYTITEELSSSLLPLESDTFTVRLNTATTGTKPVEISFSNNDGNENPFNFRITGTVTPEVPIPAPEITVLGDTGLLPVIVEIDDGDTTPSAADGTDFGNVQQGDPGPTRTYTVRNDGTETLTLDSVSVADEYTITEGLSSSLLPGDSDTFTVRLNTAITGTKTVEISFSNNDDNENPFNFTIVGRVETDELGPNKQRVSGSPSIRRIRAGHSFGFSVNYDTSDHDNSLTGLGLRMHYNSSILTFGGFHNVMQTALFQKHEQPQPDSSDDDNDPTTDTFVQISWVDINGNWPNTILPVDLFTPSFEVAAGATLGTSTSIRFSASSTAPSHSFSSQPVTVQVVPVNLDVSGDGTATDDVDGVLVMRYQFGFRRDTLVNGLPSGPHDPAKITQLLDSAKGLTPTFLNPDGSSLKVSDALNDGVLIRRYLKYPSELHWKGPDLVKDALVPGDPLLLPTWEQIWNLFDTFNPMLPRVEISTSTSGAHSLTPIALTQAIEVSTSTHIAEQPTLNAASASDRKNAFAPESTAQNTDSGTYSDETGIAATARVAGEAESPQLQKVTPNPVVQNVSPGVPITFYVDYTTDPPDPTLTGLGLRMHYDSSIVAFTAFDDVLPVGLVQQQPDPQPDSDDFDHDPKTDRYVLIAWSDVNSEWPNQISVRLYASQYNSFSTSRRSTRVNFTATSTSAGWDLDATSAEIVFNEGVNVISGYVYSDLNNTKRFETNSDDGLPKITVTLITANGRLEQSTDETGKYEFKTVDDGTHRVTFSQPRAYCSPPDAELPVTVPPSQVVNLNAGRLCAQFLSPRLFLASTGVATEQRASLLREIIALAEEPSGMADESSADATIASNVAQSSLPSDANLPAQNSIDSAMQNTSAAQVGEAELGDPIAQIGAPIYGPFPSWEFVVSQNRLQVADSINGLYPNSKSSGVQSHAVSKTDESALTTSELVLASPPFQLQRFKTPIYGPEPSSTVSEGESANTSVKAVDDAIASVHSWVDDCD